MINQIDPWRPTVLVVDDNDAVRTSLAAVLECAEYSALQAASLQEACRIFTTEHPDCVLCDYRLDREQDGLQLLRFVHERDPELPFILMTAFGSIDLAVEALKMGAKDFIQKPFEPTRLQDLVAPLLKRRSTERHPIFMTQDPQTLAIIAHSLKAARVDSPILLRGASGTGKELLSQLIHAHSTRANEPYLAINCASLPHELVESELFGHEAGAFTGAVSSRAGFFELADRGTLVLDEIGELEVAVQAKLLRALQEKRIRRLGASKTVRAAPRVIALTSRNLEEQIERGRFRPDLYYRLAVIELKIPPLAERPSDIELLSNHFLEQVNASGKHLCFGYGVQEALQHHTWPGNVRELENRIVRASLSATDVIELTHLGLEYHVMEQPTGLDLHTATSKAVRQTERDVVRRALDLCDGNKAKAARVLGVSYKTLMAKLKDLREEN